MKHENYTKAAELQKELDAREVAAKQLREFLYKNKTWYPDKPSYLEVDGSAPRASVPLWILREALNDWLTENPGRMRIKQEEFDKLPG